MDVRLDLFAPNWMYELALSEQEFVVVKAKGVTFQV